MPPHTLHAQLDEELFRKAQLKLKALTSDQRDRVDARVEHLNKRMADLIVMMFNMNGIQV